MDYFSILNLEREPFSNSPDPAYFYHSRLHVDCLQKLELSIRLRRGMNVVIGEVGTGKTTLCRQLIQRFAEDDNLETHLILDPEFPDAASFLDAVAPMICSTETAVAAPWEKKEQIKAALFEKGVEQGRTVVLIIDEGQKISAACLEILRELLNYETNEAKLLQIVIFAQTEFESVLADRENLADRINLFHRLGPLGFSDTRRMIQYRLNQAGSSPDAHPLFSLPGLWAIYRSTGGYPRKIIHLCHKSVLAAIIQNRKRAGWFLVRACARRNYSRSERRPARKLAWAAGTALLAAVVVMAGYGIDFSPWLRSLKGPGHPSPPAPTLRATVSGKIETIVGEPQHTPPVAERRSVVPPLEPARPLTADSVAGQVATTGGEPLEKAAVPTEERVPETVPREGPTSETAGGPAVHIREATAVAAVIPEPVAEAVAEPVAPELIGRSALEKYETLSWMMIKIYGDYNAALRRKVVAANPQISNPDNIAVGQPIRFPAIVVPLKPKPRNGHWIQLDEVRSLDRAFDLIRRFPPEAPAIRMVPHWNPEEGVRFNLVMWIRFVDKNDAMSQIAALPDHLGRGCRLVDAWDRADLFFADPYQVR